MTLFTTHTTGLRTVARHTVDERVRAAEERRTARAARARRRVRADALARTTTMTLPTASLRFLRPAH